MTHIGPASGLDTCDRLFLGVDETARWLGVSRSHVKRLLVGRAGQPAQLPSRKLGGRRLIAREDVLRLVGLTGAPKE
jgi:excisionase family DNA binding protein